MAHQSTMLELGTPAPDFALPCVATGKVVQLADFADTRALVVMFLCAHCPYVVHVRPELARLHADYAGKGVAFVGITSNDVAQYPQDAPAATAAMARESGLPFPILYDETQSVARAYSAACTPDFFVFDAERRLAYRGQLDDSRPMRAADRPARGTLNGKDIRAALDALLAGRAPSPEQKPSIGCNIKWKPGNEPDYFFGH
jgi:peroxiredoxin